MPRDVEAQSIGDESVKISWETPEDDGGSYITNYVVEKLDPDTGRWFHALTSRAKNCIVENLLGNKSYQFRVSAENAHGIGQPSEPSKAVLVEGQY